MTDCLAGTVPASTAMIGVEQNIPYFDGRNVAFDRLHPKLPNTAIPVIGNSITECMNVAAISSRCVNFGIGGDTMRGVLNRINRVPSVNIIHRCELVIFQDPDLNDVTYEASNWDINPPYDLLKLAAWATGKWVWIKPYPINSALFTGTTNARLKAYGVHIDNAFAGNPNVAVVDCWAALTGGGSDLLAAYSTDGQHPNAAGDAAALPLIQAAAASLGVTL